LESPFHGLAALDCRRQLGSGKKPVLDLASLFDCVDTQFSTQRQSILDFFEYRKRVFGFDAVKWLILPGLSIERLFFVH